MKPLIKYSATVFVLLLIGYSQLFVPLYSGNTIYAVTKNIKASEHGHVLIVKTTESESIFIEEGEEEDEHTYFKKLSELSSTFSHAHAFIYFAKQNISYSYYCKYFTSFVSFISPYLALRVLRL